MNQILHFPKNLIRMYNTSFFVKSPREFWEGVSIGEMAQKDMPLIDVHEVVEEFTREILLRTNESDDHIFGYFLGRIEAILTGKEE